MTKKPKVFFIIPYPLGEAPSQRFRFEQYFQILNEAGFTFSFQSFLTENNWRTFYSSGRPLQKASALIKGFVRRIFVLGKIFGYDFIFIHREAAPVGPPVIEWIIAKVFRKKIIYDFDDAIWMTDKTNESWIEKTIRWRGKVKWICKWSYKVSCGNDYLCDYAAQFAKKVILNPTTIDTEKVHNPSLFLRSKPEEKIIIGWTGSHSTLKYLIQIESALRQLEKKYSFLEFWVIADSSPKLNLKNIHFKRWTKESEISDLAQFDIGLMPLPDDEWAKGKCGFKILQYMALGIPAVASWVGINPKIIEPGKNGYLVKLDEWEQLIATLIENETLRKKIGLAGKQTVEDSYSVNSNASNFLSLLS